MPLSLICIRVRETDTDEYKKLAGVIKYMKGTIGLPFILSIDKSGNINWYASAEFLVHKYIRSHTGSFITMGKGGAYVQSIKKSYPPRFLLIPILLDCKIP